MRSSDCGSEPQSTQEEVSNEITTPAVEQCRRRRRRGGDRWCVDAVVASSREFTSPSPVGSSETQALLAALKPPKRGRPVITSIGINDATETTDYLMPHGILRRADVADVVLLATQPGPVTLFPALKVQPHATVAEFDDRQPDGADYVIVPAMSRDDDPVVLEWLRSQAAKGALMRGCRDARPSRSHRSRGQRFPPSRGRRPPRSGSAPPAWTR